MNNEYNWYVYNTGAERGEGFKEFKNINEAIAEFKKIKTPEYSALGVNKGMNSIDLANQTDGNLKISNDYLKSTFKDNVIITKYYLNYIAHELNIKRGTIMQVFPELNNIVKGQEIKIIQGMNKGKTGIITKIGGNSTHHCIMFFIIIDDVLCQYNKAFFEFTNEKIQNYYYNKQNKFIIN